MRKGLVPCSVCGAQTQERKITYTQDLEGQIYLVTDVPAQVCPQCGEQYLSPDTVDVLQEVIERGAASAQEPEKTIQVPVFAFPRAIRP